MNVTMFAPVREQCGISDYTRFLVDALPDVVRIVAAPHIAGNRAELRKRFAACGAQMNAGDVAHIQHQYFLFGGVNPLKSDVQNFLQQIRVPLVMTVHEIVLPKPTDGFAFKCALNLTNRRNFLPPKIGAYIVHTTADRTRLHSLGVSEAKIHFLPHGIPDALPMPTPEDAKRLLGLEGKRVLTLFGFLAAKKGHAHALNALVHLPGDVVLVFAGGQHPDDRSDYVANLRAQMEAQNLSSRVRITGFVAPEQIPVWMAATDVALTPFVETSGSGSLAHLMAYGVPTIASDIAPHREIAAEDAGIQLSQTEQPEPFAADIRALLNNPTQRAMMRAGAQDYAARHSFREIARQTHAIYERGRGTT